jgi:DNA-binding response OmpR family regulator
VSRILVVEDEPLVANFLGHALRSRGHLVDRVTDGNAAITRSKGGDYALLLLDLILPGIDGEVVLQQIIAERPDQKVMVVSARSGSEQKVRCLELGASDYLCKPFSVAELLARVDARLREAPATQTERYLRRGGLTLDLNRRKVNTGSTEVNLTEREFLLLAHLMRGDGKVFSRDDLLSQVWGVNFDPGTNVVDVYIRRLRRKLGNQIIETVRKAGYSFNDMQHALVDRLAVQSGT